MTATAIATALGGKRSGKSWLCRCPAHKDRSPSLSLADGDDWRLLVHCFAGCNARDVLAALRERGLLTDDKPAGREKGKEFLPSGGKRSKGNVLKEAAISAAVAGDAPLQWSDRAERIWQTAVPIIGTPAETYLRSRGCLISSYADVRFLPARQS